MAGLGLLLLRVVVGSATIFQGWFYVASQDTMYVAPMATAATCLICGVLLLIGLMTRIAAACVTFGLIGLSLSWFPHTIPDIFEQTPSTLFAGSMGAATMLLGPGAYSLDCFIFGRRKLVIPNPHRAE